MLATISFGSKLGLLNNAGIGEVYYDQFRPFLRGMDALIQANVIGRQSAPPASPSDGDAYIVLTGASGAWVGQVNNIAVYSSQITATGSNNLTPGWDFYTPNPGWVVYSVADALFYYVNASRNWVSTLATSSVAGNVVPDNTTIVINGSGVISATASAPPIATTSTLGVVKPDGTTIDVSGGGVISVPTATGSTLGLVKPDGSTITISSGILTATGGGGSGSVTSVGLSAPAEFVVSGSPITSAGTLTFAKVNQSANFVYAGPVSGASAAPSFRALVVADFPSNTFDAYGAAATAQSNAETFAISAANTAQSNAETFATSAANTAQSNAETFATSAANTAQSNAETFAADASNISSGTVGAAYLPKATSSTFGVVEPDNSTITISAGVISAAGAPPTGTAGGDLSGSYPNPTVAKVNGGVVPTSALVVGTNSSKQLVSATSANIQGAIGALVYDAYGAATTAQTNAETYASNASNISSGTVGAAFLPKATSSTFGVVEPDNTTITISGGVISAITSGSGTVTSVGLSAPGIFTVSGSPVTNSGTLTLTLTTETANSVWAGPASGGPATPSFRSLVSADLPTSHFFGEIPSGSAPTATYTLTHTPLAVFGIYYNGQFLVPGTLSPPTYDYSISGTTITLNFTTSTGSVVYAVYLY